MLKHNYRILKMYLLLITVLQFSITHLHSSAAASASYVAVRAAAKHISPIISSIDTHTAKTNVPLPQTDVIDKLPYKFTKNPSESITNAYTTKKNVDQQNNHGRLIDTQSDIEQKMQIFSKKFTYETEQFKLKLSECWSEIKKSYDEYIQDKLIATTPPVLDKSTLNPTIIKPTRDQAVVNIKLVVDKIFDPEDERPLSVYIAEIKDLTQYLNPATDQQIIDGVRFLQENQHRTSFLWDTAFWIQAIQEKKLHEIPNKLNLKPIPQETVIRELTKKSNIK